MLHKQNQSRLFNKLQKGAKSWPSLTLYFKFQFSICKCLQTLLFNALKILNFTRNNFVFTLLYLLFCIYKKFSISYQNWQTSIGGKYEVHPNVTGAARICQTTVRQMTILGVRDCINNTSFYLQLMSWPNTRECCTTLGWKGLPSTNAVAYSVHS